MWSIVHFLDDNSVQAVPSFWVVKDKCAWPKNNYNLGKIRYNRIKPNEIDFNYYRARVFSKKISVFLQ